jgi:hypothetical protein
MDIRVATKNYLSRLLHDMNAMHSGDNGKADKITKFVWWSSHFIGSAIFVFSFGAIAAPFIAGWSVVQSVLLWTSLQFVSGVFLSLHKRWIAVAASFKALGTVLSRQPLEA